jgi:uncharacterized protein GlcG (DUF336 family)
MTFENTLRADKIHTNRSWKSIFMKHPLLNLLFISLLAGLATPSTLSAQVQAAPLTGTSSSQPSQTTAYHYTVPLSLALEAATEAVRVCAQHGYLVSAAVVDMDGVPQVTLRGDGATIHTKESSFDKAYTVVTLGPIFDFDTSGKFFDLMKTSPFAPRLSTMTNVMALPGAVALKSKNAIVGALGVGGAPGGDKDEVCAQAGVKKIADRLPN